MNINTKKTALIILGITSLIGSKVFFLSVNDPEGPNLVVMLAAALFIYALSAAVYTYGPALKGAQRLAVAIVAQVLIVLGLCLFLK